MVGVLVAGVEGEGDGVDGEEAVEGGDGDGFGRVIWRSSGKGVVFG